MFLYVCVIGKCSNSVVEHLQKVRLEKRHLRGDMLVVYKIMDGVAEVERVNFFFFIAPKLEATH